MSSRPLRELLGPPAGKKVASSRREEQGLGQDPIDAFILAKLEEKNLQPNPTPGNWTLLRRVTIDMTGLPPTQEEIQQFVSDKSPIAWEKVVDRLLASPAYGERWAAIGSM